MKQLSRLTSIYRSLPLTNSNQKQQNRVIFSDQSKLLKKGYSYGTLTLTAIAVPLLTNSSLLVEPAQAEDEKGNIGQEHSGENSNAAVEIEPMVEHKIQPGDTLWQLSQIYETSPEEIAQYNGIDSPHNLQPGQVIKIPIPKNANLDQPQLLSSESDASVSSTESTAETETADNTQRSDSSVSSTESTAETVTSDNSEVNVSHNDTVEDHNNQATEPSLNTTSATVEDSQDHSQQSVPALLADVEQLQRRYQEPLRAELWNEGVSKNRDQQLLSPMESDVSDSSSDDSLDSSTLEVEIPESDQPHGIAKAPDLPALSAKDNYLPSEKQQRQYTDQYIWPAEGIFTSGYGMRGGRMHEGIDVAAPIGTPVVASTSGKVIFAGWHNGGYGKLIKLQHSDQTITLYAHNNKILVREGQWVEQGEQIAEMGTTGRSTGPHVHFELHPSEQEPVDPLAYLPEGEGVRQGQKIEQRISKK